MIPRSGREPTSLERTMEEKANDPTLSSRFYGKRSLWLVYQSPEHQIALYGCSQASFQSPVKLENLRAQRAVSKVPATESTAIPS